MAAPHAVATPQINQAFRPARLRFAQALDIAQRGSIGTGIVVGEGGVIAQTHAQGQLNRDHGGLGDFNNRSTTRYAELQRLLEPFAARLQHVQGDHLVYLVNANPEQLRAQLALGRLQEGAAEVAPDAAAAVPAPAAASMTTLKFHW